MKRLRGLRGAAGFSLIEMLAALMIFSVGVMAVIEAITTSLQATTATIEHGRAVMLARRVMEETLMESSPADEESGDFGEAYPNHQWARRLADTDEEGLREVRVTVTWTERGRQKRYDLVTLTATHGTSEWTSVADSR